jgi:uncharacterized protein (TIGR00251 family)
MSNDVWCDLTIKVTPGASRNHISQILEDGTIKVSLVTRPIEGKANEALKKLLSEVLDIPASNIWIIRGEKSRNKLIRIKGIDGEFVNHRLMSFPLEGKKFKT